jgi:hypothetical protein
MIWILAGLAALVAFLVWGRPRGLAAIQGP